MKVTKGRYVRWFLCVAATLTVLSGAMYTLVAPPTGFVRTLYSSNDFAGEPLFRERTTDISLAFLDADPALPRRFLNVEWSGYWFLPTTETVEVFAGADDKVDIFVDGQLLLRRDPFVGMHSVGKTITLAEGAHQIVVRYQQEGGDAGLSVARAHEGGGRAPFTPREVFPHRADTADYLLANLTFWVVGLTSVFWLVATIALCLAVVVRACLWVALRIDRSPAGRRNLNRWQTARGAFERTTGMTIARTLHPFALTAVVVAQPLFDVVSREPAFFVARNTTATHLVALVSIVCIVVPGVLVSIEIALTRFGAVAAKVARGLVLTALGAAALMPLLKRLDGLGAGQSIGLAVTLACAAALAYWRYGVVQTFVTALSPAVIVVPAAFLMNADVRASVVRTDLMFSAAEVTDRPPIVVVVFDEFPVSSLMDANYEIDAVRYPNFARLASTATWYRNATTVSSQTAWAVPAIVSGKYPIEPHAVPTRRYFPNNLFTMLSGSYRMTVFGRFLQLCPANRCDYDLEVHDSLESLVADLAIVYLHIISPPEQIAANLPPIVGDWRDFAARRRFRDEEGASRRNDRASEFDRFLRRITPEPEGSLYFLHTLTPHMPFEYVPSGHRYSAPGYQHHREGGKGLFLQSDPWLPRLLQQQHLLQVGFVDRFIGQLLERLETQGVYNDALIIITADHGVSFQHGLPRRAARDGTRADVMLVPLIVKYPGQVAGLISAQNVETVDIVPTIAEVLSTTVPYDVDGRSVLDVTKPERVDKSYVHRNATNAIIQKHEPMLGDRYAGLREKLLRFESGLYALGPHALLVGRPLSSLDVRTSTKSAIRLEDPLVFDNVDLDGDRLPLFVSGAMTEVAENHVSIAIAVNGTVVATTQSYLEHDQWVFASMIPEEVLLSGDNDLRVFVVSVTSEGTVLTLATSTS